MKALARDDYAKVGLQLLAESGVAGVTIATACARLGVTKGSFYHHFSGVDDLRVAMLEYWEEQYARIRPAFIEDLSPSARLDAVVDAGINRNHEVEKAIRTWSHADDAAAQVQQRLDALRIQFVADTLVACGVSVENAETYSRMGLSLLAGLQTFYQPIDRNQLRRALNEWRQVLYRLVESETGVSMQHIDTSVA